MTLCNYGHDEVCFDGRNCPCCDLVREVKDLKEVNADLEKKISDLENENDDLRNEAANHKCPEETKQ